MSEQVVGVEHTAPLIDDEHGMASEVSAAVTGLDAIQPFPDEPSVEKAWVN